MSDHQDDKGSVKRRTLILGGVSAAAGTAVGAWWLGRRDERPRGMTPDIQGEAPRPPVEPVPSPPTPIEQPRPTSGGKPRRDRPNVLMIAIDDMKPWIGPHGFTQAHTPALDALSERGLIFRRAYCAAPACSPSRAAVLTGIPPHESGVYFNRHNWRDTVPGAITLPRRLRDAGYFTAGYGKIFHGKRHDDKAAWDERTFHTHLPVPKKAPLNGLDNYWREAGKLDWGPVDVPVEAMDDHKQVDRAVAAMNAKRDRPWFVTCGIFRPHLPWYVPKQFFDMHPLESVRIPEVIENDLDDVPAKGRWFVNQREHKLIVSRGLWKPAVQAYMASISYADFELGRLLAGTPPDTTIVVWSDHGWHLGPKNHWQKYTLWEESAQTVLALAGPGVARGAFCDRTVGLVDVYPTICDLCDIEPPPGLRGRSVVPLAKDPKAAWNRPALTTYGAGNHSIRSERYRYIHYKDGGAELYDHDVDPHEWTNLVGTPGAAAIIADHARWLPTRNAPSRPADKKQEGKGGRDRSDRKEKRRKRRRKGQKKRRQDDQVWLELPDSRRVLVPV